MTFADMLKKHMEGRTLEEVCNLCARHGVKIGTSYLSRLRAGTRPAPDDELLVITLAMALDMTLAETNMFIWLAELERRPFKVFLESMLLTEDLVAAVLPAMERLTSSVGLALLAKDDKAALQVKELREVYEETQRFRPQFKEMELELKQYIRVLGDYAERQETPLTKKRTGSAPSVPEEQPTEPTEEVLVVALSRVTGVDPGLIMMSLDVLKKAQSHPSDTKSSK